MFIRPLVPHLPSDLNSSQKAEVQVGVTAPGLRDDSLPAAGIFETTSCFLYIYLVKPSNGQGPGRDTLLCAVNGGIFIAVDGCSKHSGEPAAECCRGTGSFPAGSCSGDRLGILSFKANDAISPKGFLFYFFISSSRGGDFD